MYAAKQSGKGRFEHFDADMSTGLLHDLRLRQELAEALEPDQFFLLYQPMYDLRTNRLCGAEALVRWAHPSGATLAPAAFLRQAETERADAAARSALLERACREVRDWLDRAPIETGLLRQRQPQRAAADRPDAARLRRADARPLPALSRTTCCSR